VLREAARRGHETVALTRSDEAAAAVTALGATPVSGNLDDGRSLDHAFITARCDALVNLASLGFSHAPAIVTAAELAGLSRAVFVSTTAITTSLPARSKRIRLAAEEQVRASALDWTILRPTMIYGDPGDRNLSRLLPLLRRAPVLPVPGGGHLQQPVHAADVADAVLAAAERPATARCAYDVAGPEPLTFAELLRVCARAVASRTRFVPVPLAPVVAAARGYELLSRNPRIRVEQLRRLAEDKAFSIDAAARDLGYAPRPFAAGIRAEARAMGLAA
jgi:nucleoside-diphosphate-sugar epimerase